MTARILFRCAGGDVALPDSRLVLVSRLDGGNLIVNPPREVWDRSELSPLELTQWSFLVAAAGRAMIDALSQLEGGCINYWEAGNWALNEMAEPRGPKTAREHRRVHLHLLGRSPKATHPGLRWGEAPKFPDFADRYKWAAGFERLTPKECAAIVERIERKLRGEYGFKTNELTTSLLCSGCAYPSPQTALIDSVCAECRASS